MKLGMAVMLIAAMAATGAGRVITLIPDGSGALHACYNTTNGAVRLVGSDADCRNGEGC